jgi:hypothetical protein
MYPTLDYNASVLVLGLEDPVPLGAKPGGTVKVGDSGLSTNCGYEVVIEKAREEARKAGCNIVKITDHNPPGFSSSCDRITASIYRVDDLSSLPQVKTEEKHDDWDYAMLYIYRPGGVGPLVSYDVYLGDSVIWRAKNNSKTEIRIKKKGINSIWAKTESKEEVPVTIEYGREYYLRCGLSMGIMVGRPTMTLVDFSTGRAGFNATKSK